MNLYTANSGDASSRGNRTAPDCARVHTHTHTHTHTQAFSMIYKGEDECRCQIYVLPQALGCLSAAFAQLSVGSPTQSI